MEPITRKEIYLIQIARNTGGSGGDTGLTPITREEHYFDAIVKNTASGGGGGGSSLPAVTSEDNGDVLTVVNGAWDKAAPSGGVMIIHLDMGTGVADKTWQQVHDALAAGVPVYLLFASTGELGQEYTFVYPCYLATYNDPTVSSPYAAGFLAISTGPDGPCVTNMLYADTANDYLHF